MSTYKYARIRGRNIFYREAGNKEGPAARPPFSRSASDYEIDEALWAAYRRYDKSAVTEQLLRRYLTALAFLPNESTARTADRQPGGGN